MKHVDPHNFHFINNVLVAKRLQSVINFHECLKARMKYINSLSLIMCNILANVELNDFQ